MRARFPSGLHPSAHIPLARASSHGPPVRVYEKCSLVRWPDRRENPLDEDVSATGCKEAWPCRQGLVSDRSGLEVDSAQSQAGGSPHRWQQHSVTQTLRVTIQIGLTPNSYYEASYYEASFHRRFLCSVERSKEGRVRADREVVGWAWRTVMTAWVCSLDTGTRI